MIKREVPGYLGANIIEDALEFHSPTLPTSPKIGKIMELNAPWIKTVIKWGGNGNITIFKRNYIFINVPSFFKSFSNHHVHFRCWTPLILVFFLCVFFRLSPPHNGDPSPDTEQKPRSRHVARWAVSRFRCHPPNGHASHPCPWPDGMKSCKGRKPTVFLKDGYPPGN